MQLRELEVTSIRPGPGDGPGIDLKHILSALAPKLGGWSWCVRHLEWLGADDEPFCQAVEAAGPGGYWLDSESLVQRASGIYQTIEGDFLAFPAEFGPADVGPSDQDASSFAEGRAIVKIVATDGCYFDVFSKDREVSGLLHAALPDVRDEDPSLYLESDPVD